MSDHTVAVQIDQIDQIAQARLVGQVPANAQNDQIAIKVTACE